MLVFSSSGNDRYTWASRHEIEGGSELSFKTDGLAIVDLTALSFAQSPAKSPAVDGNNGRGHESLRLPH